MASSSAPLDTARGNGVPATVNLVSAPEIYLHEWLSFSTKDFPENCRARAGDTVRIVITDIQDARPVEDVLWPDEAYRGIYGAARLEVAKVHKPLGRPDEPQARVNQSRIAPLGHLRSPRGLGRGGDPLSTFRAWA